MLTDLEISDLGIIDSVSLELSPGLNVLTGETGAGKTMVVSGLQWLLGARADRDRVRSGARSAVVTARIAPPPASAQDWHEDDEALIVTREVGGKDADGSSTGRSRARIGSRLAPVSGLSEALGGVIEVISQHEALRMADPKVQRALLDRFGGDDVLLARDRYRQAFRAWRSAVEALDKAQEAARDGAREADHLRMELTEIDAVDPTEDEEEHLDAEIARMEHVEALRAAAATAVAATSEDGAARDNLGTAVAALRGVEVHDAELTGPLQRLEGALAEVQDVAIDLTSYLEGLDADPDALDETLSRRAAIGGLLRKYGATTRAVRDYADQARQRLALIDGGEQALVELKEAVAEARDTLDRDGVALRDARAAAGAALAAAADRHLADLAMPAARMTVVVDPADPGPDGADRVEFLLAANPGQPSLPLGRSASGGERSRVALALRVALAHADDTPILVFDEVDAGIGGQTALMVGEKLATLARNRQVLCVTHLAQLAAYADAHFVVRKSADDATTTTDVVRLTPDERVEELSRMLSGTPDSDAAATHAAELLETARSRRVPAG